MKFLHQFSSNLIFECVKFYVIQKTSNMKNVFSNKFPLVSLYPQSPLDKHYLFLFYLYIFLFVKISSSHYISFCILYTKSISIIRNIFSFVCWFNDYIVLVGEGNDNPLQYSCPENPVGSGTWWATVRGVTKSRTQLKRLSTVFYCMDTT